MTTSSRLEGAPTFRPRISQETRGDLLVGLVVLGALAAGWLYQNSLNAPSKPVTDEASGLSLSLPAHWQTDPLAEDAVIAAFDPRSASAFKTMVAAYSRDLDPDAPLTMDQLVDRRVNERSEAVTAYQLIAITPTTVSGAEAREIEYAYVERPIDQSFRAALPVVVHATDYLILTKSQYFVVTFAADQAEFEKERGDFEAILGTVKVS